MNIQQKTSNIIFYNVFHKLTQPQLLMCSMSNLNTCETSGRLKQFLVRITVFVFTVKLQSPPDISC